MSERKYDTSRMSGASQDIKKQVADFKNAADEVERIVTRFQSWEDEVNLAYVARYKSELKPALENVRKHMDDCANFLDGAADAIEEYVRKNKNAL